MQGTAPRSQRCPLPTATAARRRRRSQLAPPLATFARAKTYSQASHTHRPAVLQGRPPPNTTHPLHNPPAPPPVLQTITDPAQAAADLVRGASTAFMQTQCLYTAAKLGVADALAAAGGSASAADVAKAVGTKHDELERVLRFLAAMGIFEEPRRGARLQGGRGGTDSGAGAAVAVLLGFAARQAGLAGSLGWKPACQDERPNRCAPPPCRRVCQQRRLGAAARRAGALNEGHGARRGCVGSSTQWMQQRWLCHLGLSWHTG